MDKEMQEYLRNKQDSKITCQMEPRGTCSLAKLSTGTKVTLIY